MRVFPVATTGNSVAAIGFSVVATGVGSASGGRPEGDVFVRVYNASFYDT